MHFSHYQNFEILLPLPLSRSIWSLKLKISEKAHLWSSQSISTICTCWYSIHSVVPLTSFLS